MPVSRVVIVGGGFGGLKLAKELRNAPVKVTLIDKNNHHLFQPLLYQVATAGLSPADIAAPIRAVLRHQKNTEVILGEVTGVDPQGKSVFLSDRSIAFDYLVLATGSTHSYFGHPEWERYAPGLKRIEDAERIREKVLYCFEAAESEPDPAKRTELLSFVIVGGGPTGVELAGALYELSHISLSKDFRNINPRSTRIALVEAGPRLLAGFSPSSSEKARLKLESFGVEVRVNSRVGKVDEDGVVIGAAGAEERIRAKTVLWAAGVESCPAACWLGIPADRVGRAKVLPDLSAPGHPDIFVIGDAATLLQHGKPLPGVAPVALQEAKYLSRLIGGELAGRITPENRKPFRYREKGNLATVGRSYALAEFDDIRTSGFVAWLLWLVVHIYYLIGFRNRIIVFMEWIWAYATFQRGARLIVRETWHEAGEDSSQTNRGSRVA